MKNTLLLIVGMIIVTILPVIAQPGDPGEDPGGNLPMGGIVFLLIAGLLLGIMKMMKRKNNLSKST